MLRRKIDLIFIGILFNASIVGLIFPEIDYMRVDKNRGMNISMVTTARTDEEGRQLLKLLGMPFRQN